MCLAVSATPGVAAAATNGAWNCEQNQSGEWTCLNDGSASAAPASPPKPLTKPTAPAQPAPQQTVKTDPAPTPQTPAATAAPTPTASTTASTPAPAIATPTTASAPAAIAEKKPLEALKQRLRLVDKPKPSPEAPKLAPEPSLANNKESGWTCQSGDNQAKWNCNLVGPDPQGDAKVVAETAVDNPWLPRPFTRGQEQSFQALRAEFEHDPWQNCSSWSGKKRKLQSPAQGVRDGATTDVNADFTEVFDGEIMSFAGNVDLRRADQHVTAEKASYDTVSETVDAQGHVMYSETALAFSSETASFSLGKDEARLRNTLFIAAEAPLRGSAETVYRDSKSLSRYNDAAITSCPPGNQDWVAHAERLKIDRDSGKGSAKNAWLEFKGVPVAYTPYISFPVDNRRLSGFLSPTWGSSQRNGFDTSLPYYWNIAPNADTLFTARYMDKRGVMFRNKFRYLTDISRGSLFTEYLPFDDQTGKARYLGSFKDQTIFTPHLSSLIDLNYASDKTYFNDLNNALGIQTARFLNNTAFINYGRQNVAFSAGVQHYQSIDKTITDQLTPYDVLPRINLNLSHPFQSLPLTVAMDNQYSYFYHDVNVNGQRLALAPSISAPLESGAGFLIPKITGHFTQYQLSNQALTGQPDSISRTLPIFSLDTGLQFEKQLNLAGMPYSHTIEPRLFYLYIPRKDQSAIPVFDSSAFDTNFYSLFRENRFSGSDRIQDANQVTLAMTSRFIDSTTGLEPMKVSAGQIVYFQDRTVNMPGVPTQISQTSNFVGEFSGQMTKHLSYMTGAQWDPENNAVGRGQAVLKYRSQPNEIFDIGYRYRRTSLSGITNVPQAEISQTDVSFRWPLLGDWYGLGRWQYALNFDKTTESFIGVERENCCWRFRILGRRFINGAYTSNILDPDAKPETAFFVQLELKGLTSFGDSIDTFLQTNLNGYRKASYFD